MYTLGRFRFMREAALLFYRTSNPPVQGAISRSTDLELTSIDEVAGTLRADGAYSGLRLSASTLKEVLAYCQNSTCYGDGEREYPFHIVEKSEAEERYGRRFLVGRYLDCRHNCPAMKRLENDPTLRAIARKYFGSEPVLVGSRIWWSYASQATLEQQSKSGQTYHYDIDGYRSVSYFFYLTDVDQESGAHTYVRGSHLKKRLRHLFSLHKSRSDAEIENVYSQQDIRVVCGEAGLGLAEDTFCFHKGMNPRLRDRLMLQIRFGLRDYGTGPER
jgi:hypothetical protein